MFGNFLRGGPPILICHSRAGKGDRGRSRPPFQPVNINPQGKPMGAESPGGLGDGKGSAHAANRRKENRPCNFPAPATPFPPPRNRNFPQPRACLPCVPRKSPWKRYPPVSMGSTK